MIYLIIQIPTSLPRYIDFRLLIIEHFLKQIHLYLFQKEVQMYYNGWHFSQNKDTYRFINQGIFMN